MATYTKLEEDFEALVRDWKKALDEIDAEEAAEEKMRQAEMAAAKAEAKAKVQKTVADMHAKFDAARDKVTRAIDEQSEKLNAALDNLDADIAKAQGKAKADLEAKRATLRSNRAKLQARMQATLEMQLKQIETRINEIEAWADSANANVRAKVKDEVTVLRQRGEAAEQAIDLLKASQQAAWNENKAKADRAIKDLKAGYKKAISEFKTPTE